MWLPSLLIFCLALLFNFLPVDPSYFRMEIPLPANTVAVVHIDDLNPLFETFVGEGGYPLVIKPGIGTSTDSSELINWLTTQEERVQNLLLEYGAIILRGFAVPTPQVFEEISLALEPNLESVYEGTSPRNKVPGCRFTHTASEFAGWKIIAAHLEMSFRPNPPKRIFFYANSPNQGPGGQTPLIDFRQVWRDMDRDVKTRFQEKGIGYTRRYYSNNSWSLDPLKTKTWQAMLGTSDPEEAIALATKQGYTAKWDTPESQNTSTLVLSNSHGPSRVHPNSNYEMWSNHVNVLHPSSFVAEHLYAAIHLQSWLHVCYAFAWKLVEVTQRLVLGTEGLGQHATHANGEEIMDSDVRHMRELIWNNTFAASHQKGDVVMLDNWRIGHARQPFHGPRSILTTWA